MAPRTPEAAAESEQFGSQHHLRGCGGREDSKAQTTSANGKVAKTECEIVLKCTYIPTSTGIPSCLIARY